MTICDGCDKEVFRARWVEGAGWFCKDCDPGTSADKKVPGSMFPYDTMNLSAEPKKIRVNSLHHLRQLEREHGVQSIAFNDNESNWRR